MAAFSIVLAAAAEATSAARSWSECSAGAEYLQLMVHSKIAPLHAHPLCMAIFLRRTAPDMCVDTFRRFVGQTAGVLKVVTYKLRLHAIIPLYRFSRLSHGTDRVSIQQLAAVPELCGNPFVQVQTRFYCKLHTSPRDSCKCPALNAHRDLSASDMSG